MSDSEWVPIWDVVPIEEARENLTVAFKRRNDLYGLIKPDQLGYLVEWFLINRAWTRDPKHATTLRNWGRKLTSSDRKALGLEGKAGLGSNFVNLMTARGLADPDATSKAIIYWPWHEEQQFVHGKLIVEDDTLIRYRVDARTCCKAALSFVKGVADNQNGTTFPLPDCTTIKCTCGFERYSEKVHGPIENDLRTSPSAELAAMFGDFDSQNTKGGCLSALLVTFCLTAVGIVISKSFT
jgi:hypothetical protein